MLHFDAKGSSCQQAPRRQIAEAALEPTEVDCQYKKKRSKLMETSLPPNTHYLTPPVVHPVYGFMVISAGSAVNFPTVLYDIMLSFPRLLFHLHKSAGTRAFAFD